MKLASKGVSEYNDTAALVKKSVATSFRETELIPKFVLI